MLTKEEYRTWLQKRILRHLAIRAGQAPGRFVVPTMTALKRATWCENAELILNTIDALVEAGQIRVAGRYVNGEFVLGYMCLPAKLRTRNERPTSGDLRLTPEDENFLRSCGIAAGQPEVVAVR